MDKLLGKNIKHLRKRKGLTQDQLAKKVGLNRAMIGSYEEGRAAPKLIVMRDLAHYFNVNVDDLVSSDLGLYDSQREGKDFGGKDLRIVTTIVDKEKKELVTLVPIKASAGYANGYGDPDFIENLPHFSLPIPELSRERTYRIFQIKGDSMEPIHSGSYIICEYVENWLDIKDGKTYVIITKDEGVVYKRLYHKEKNKLLLKSDNTQYQSFTISMNDVSEIWRALGYISLNLPEPEEININKLTIMMQDMRSELDELKKTK